MFEAYSIAIRISLINTASVGLGLLSRNFSETGVEASALQRKIEGVQRQMRAGLAIGTVGVAGLTIVDKLANASKEYTSQISLMNAAGMGQQEVAGAVAAAWKTSGHVITSTAADNLKTLRELRSVFGDKNIGEAYSILPTVQRLSGAMTAMTGKPQEGVGFDLVKSAELRTRGVLSEESLQRNADLMSKTLMAMGGTLSVNDFHSTLKQTKMAAFGLNDDFVYNYLPTLMQEFKTGKGGGAQGAGTALMTAYQAVVGGVLKKSAIPAWMEAGLISNKDVVKNATGQIQVRPGAVKDTALFQANPYDWANKVLRPGIKKFEAKEATHGHIINDEQAIAGMFGNRNAQVFFTTLIEKAAQFARDKTIINTATNSKDAYDKLIKTNPELAEQALHAKWKELLSTLGYQVMPMLIKGTLWLSENLRTLTGWVERNATLAKTIVVGFAAMSAAMTIGGTLFVVSAALRGYGLTLLFSQLGGAASIIRVASSIRIFGGAMLMSEVGGAGGILSVGKSLTNVAGAIGLVAQAAGVMMAAYAGWKAGGWIGNNLINPAVAKATGQKDDTLGSALYDFANPFNQKTGKREFSGGRLFDWAVSSNPNALLGSKLPADRAAEKDWMSSSHLPVKVPTQNTTAAPAIPATAKPSIISIQLAPKVVSTPAIIPVTQASVTPIQSASKVVAPRSVIPAAQASVVPFRPSSKVADAQSANPVAAQSYPTKSAPANGVSPFIATKQMQTVQVNSTINVDGKAVAKAVTTHQVDAATRPQTGLSYFDSSQMAMPIGLNGSN